MNFHGGDIYRHSGGILDFSSNINPLGVPESFKRLLLEKIDDFTRYPDIEYVEVREKIACYLGIEDIDSIIPGNGAVELIYKLAACVDAKSAVGLSPTFSEYKRAAGVSGLKYSGIPAFNENYSAVDMEMLLQAIRPNTLVIICNPNNPTGTFIEKSDMMELAGALDNRQCKLIIDETFIEFTDGYPGNSMSNAVKEYKNTTVIRAATKFFGMPGIRLGYAITTDKAIAKGIRDIMEPWNLNSAAVIAASSIYEDQNYIDNTRIWIRKEREFLYEELSNLKELQIYPSKANYHLLNIAGKKMTAAELKEAMLSEGILIRTAEGFDNLSEFYFRLAVKDRNSNKILVKALSKMIE